MAKQNEGNIDKHGASYIDKSGGKHNEGDITPKHHKNHAYSLGGKDPHASSEYHSRNAEHGMPLGFHVGEEYQHEGGAHHLGNNVCHED